MRAAVKDQAELIAISYADRMDLTYGSDQEMEKAYRQYVSGWMFGTFGLQPAAGRLFTENDDLNSGRASLRGALLRLLDAPLRTGSRQSSGAPSAWAIDLYEIVGVAEAALHRHRDRHGDRHLRPHDDEPRGRRNRTATWFRTLARLKPGVAAWNRFAQKLHATSRAFEEERAKGFTGMTKQVIDRFLNQTLLLEPAAAGRSGHAEGLPAVRWSLSACWWRWCC